MIFAFAERGKDVHAKVIGSGDDRSAQADGGRAHGGGVPRGTPRSSRYGHGRTRALPSLNQVLEDNGLPQSTPPPRGERRVLDEKRLHAFYTELQVASRVEVNRGGSQIEEQREMQKLI